MTVGGASAHVHAIAVDWAEIEFKAAKATNFDTVRKVLQTIWTLLPVANPYVEPQDAGEGGSARVFRFRIHDPDQFHAINKTLTGLNRRFEFIGIPRLTAIEIAHDTRFEGATKRQLAEITADRYRFCVHIPERKWHFYRESGEKPVNIDDQLGRDGQLSRDQIVQYFEDEWQLADTPDKDTADIRRHMYVKTSNNSGNDNLDQAVWSARDEITLRGKELPCQTVEELATYPTGKVRLTSPVEMELEFSGWLRSARDAAAVPRSDLPAGLAGVSEHP